MKPIWYFVGMLLMIVGMIILGEGIRLLASPDGRTAVLSATHPDIWWGSLMTVVGGVFMIANRNKTVA